MGFLERENIRVIHFKEDYTFAVGRLPVERYASDVITKMKDGARDKSWELAHLLMKKCYGIPGIPDGKKALMICSRDVVYNPLNQYPDLYNPKAISARMGEMAHEQQHKADSDTNSGPMRITTIFLGAAAFILIGSVVLIAFLNYYKGI